jgi:FAD/FMN-containing dehydrogenase
MSCDNLRSIEIVTADGSTRTASRDQHPDLFWAARGGGRGIGVVTSFEFDLHPLGPQITTALVLYPYTSAERVLRTWREVARDAPDTLTPEIALWSIPPLPDIPHELHGSKVILVASLYAGPAGEAAAVLAPLRQLTTPLADLTGTMPYVDWQSALDPLFPDGGRYYWKSHFLDGLSDDLISVLLDHDANRPRPESVIFIRTLGGDVARLGDNDSAYAHRAAGYSLSVDASWADPERDDAAIAWAQTTWNAVQPHATGGMYINFAGLADESSDLRQQTFGTNEERLDRIRKIYDLDGLFDAPAQRP